MSMSMFQSKPCCSGILNLTYGRQEVVLDTGANVGKRLGTLFMGSVVDGVCTVLDDEKVMDADLPGEIIILR